ncbi:MAG: hypothetical protein A4E45_01591 [Methanosaeta sp. PtaB.Bin039]|nr:MAG: hypothetical protein A4E45_01591 [Methanosaeta sp. PtaB.Bin039]OPY46855.1 MAG: hypothetical protein A4E47_00466 [Methanosaeta sp. PtaU1.Bin028]
MFRVAGWEEADSLDAETFIDALRIIHELCSAAPEKRDGSSDPKKVFYIEAVGETATARLYYPYAFEFAVKAGLIRYGKLKEDAIEPTVSELIAVFSRAAVLQLTAGMGCH